jgi:G3E family GTPase
MLDAVVTVVDAVHGPDQLTAHAEAQAQVGFADRILMSKTIWCPPPMRRPCGPVWLG